MQHDTVLVVTEFDPDDLPSGVHRRADHVAAALRLAGATVQTVSLSPGRSRRTLGLRGRLAAARRADALVPPATPAVVIGLGTPTMAMAARVLQRSGRPVVLDESDSVLMQLGQRIRVADPRLVLIAIWQLAMHLTAPEALGLSYISRRDARADRSIRRARRTIVVPPVPAAELRALPPVRHPLQRIVVPVELASHHSARGFRMLLDALRATPVSIPVEIWGPTPPGLPLPSGLRYAGFADRLADLYAGDTGVLVVNIGGSGVPNKLVEAAASARPVLVHESIAGRLPAGVRALTFGDSTGIAAAIDRLRMEEPPLSAARQPGAVSSGRLLLAALTDGGGEAPRAAP